MFQESIGLTPVHRYTLLQIEALGQYVTFALHLLASVRKLLPSTVS